MSAQGRDLSSRFSCVFERIAEGAVQRERNRELPHPQVRWLAEAGFTAVSLPESSGGAGATRSELFALLIELGAADSNLPQLLRAHFAFIEELLLSGDREEQERWFPRIAAGEVFGNATHERSAAGVGELVTHLQQDGEDYVLHGIKAYSTGTLFADWTNVAAVTPDGGRARVTVPVGAAGVDAKDDWNGFGQRLTGSGTTTFTGVRVPAEAVRPQGEQRRTPMAAFVQIVLLATLAGVALAAQRDAVDFVRRRTRHYSQGVGATAAQDPLVQTVVGRVSTDAVTARALVLHAAAALDAAHEAVVSGVSGAAAGAAGDSGTGDAPEVAAAIDAAELVTVQVQSAVVDAALRAATTLFEVGGASATDADRALDRHWRNARVLSSHNPVVFQQRVIGDHLVNGGELTYFWATGETRSGQTG